MSVGYTVDTVHVMLLPVFNVFYFTLALSEICVRCPTWLCSVVLDFVLSRHVAQVLLFDLTVCVPCIMFQCVDKPTRCSTSYEWSFFFYGACSPIAGYGLLILEVFEITYLDTPQSVGLLWTSDQPVAETSTWQHTTLTTDRHPCPRRDSNTQSQQASGRRPTS